MSRRLRRRRGRGLSGWHLLGATAALVLAGLVAAFAVAYVRAVRMEHRLAVLPSQLSTVQSEVEDGQIRQALDQLTGIQTTLESVNNTLFNSASFDIVSLVPIAHQNLAAMRDGIGVGLRAVSAGRTLLEAAAPLQGPTGRLEVPLSNGQVPLATLRSVQIAINSAIAELPLGVPANNGLVLGRISQARDKVYADAASRRSELVSVSRALSLLADMAGANGDRHYFVAASNSAEMRGTGGMYLSYGILSSHAGKFSISRFRDTATINLRAPETSVVFPPDVMRSLGGLDPTADWRNVNLVSDFTLAAPVMEAMYRQETGTGIDGVIQVDSAALAALLSAIGPVPTADLGTVTATNAVPLTLNQAYFLYPNRTSRQDYMGEAASAAFDRLLSGSFPSVRQLGTALLQAGRQRHLLFQTADPTDEALVAGLGMSGALPPDSTPFVELTVQNAGGTKLDYYLASSLTLDGGRPSPQGAELTATVTLDNTAPAGVSTPSEIFGAAGAAGTYQGFVTVYLPSGSRLLSSSSDALVTSPPQAGSQNGVPTVTYTVAIPAGQRSAVSLQVVTGPSPGRAGYEWVAQPRVLPTVFSQHLH